MRILVFTTLYYIEGRKDLVRDTNAIHYLLKNLSEEHEILVINTYVNTRKYLYRYFKPSNLLQYFRDYRFEKDGIRVHMIETQVITGRYFHEMEWRRLARRSRKILEQEVFKPDMIISHFPSYSYGFIDRLGTDCKKIAVLHSTDLYHAKHRKAFVNGLKEHFDAVFCRAEYIRDQMKQYQIPQLREDIVYSGTILPKKTRAKQFGKDKAYTIVYVGKLIKRKRIDWIIRCLEDEQLSSCSLWIVGSGPEERKLRAQAAHLKGRVKFWGQVERERAQEIMNHAEIFCMPSVEETFGLVYLEAMACGCIVIGTKNEGIDGIIRNGKNGFLIDSEESLKNCLREIVLSEASKMENISREAQCTANDFSEEKISEKYIHLVQEVVRSNTHE